MNIVCDGSSLKPVKQEAGRAYSLDELVFFVAKKYMGYKLYLIIKSGAKFDAVELKQSNSTNKDYYNFVCAENYPVKIQSGACEFSLLGFTPNSTSPEFSTSSISIQFNNDTYNFKAQINVIEQFSKASAEVYKGMYAIYEQMISLSKLNIDALNDKTGGQ